MTLLGKEEKDKTETPVTGDAEMKSDGSASSDND